MGGPCRHYSCLSGLNNGGHQIDTTALRPKVVNEYGEPLDGPRPTMIELVNRGLESRRSRSPAESSDGLHRQRFIVAISRIHA
jgi:hypothetical protein